MELIMQILENGTQVPTNGDPYNLTDDLAEMGITAGSVYKVASESARDALTTVSAGSVVSRTDLPSAPLETFDGTNWSVSDSDWTNVPLAGGFTHWTTNGWSGMKYAVRNGWVILNGAVTKDTAWAGDATCGVIPASLRPAVRIQGSAGVQVEPTAGNVSLLAGGPGPVSFSATWPLF
jgi:hypothetical protein